MNDETFPKRASTLERMRSWLSYLGTLNEETARE